MGAKSEQLLVLKEEEKLLLTFRSRINDQLNRLKVEELSILSLMRKAQEEAYAGDEINLDEIGNDNDSGDESRDGDGTALALTLPTARRDISHLTSMTGGFRTQGPSGGGTGMASAVFRVDPGDDRITTMEVDLGDFESGSGSAFGGADFGSGGLGGSFDFAPTEGSGKVESHPAVGGSNRCGLDLVPLDLGLGKAPKGKEMEEEDDDDDD